MGWLTRSHLLMGLLGLLAFVLGGQYMHWALDGLEGTPPAPRLLYRSAHIYLLLSSLINLFIGLYLQPATRRSYVWLQGLGGLALLAGPPVLTISFFIESPAAQLDRPLAATALYLALAGAVLHVAARLHAWLFTADP
ncbi:MAG: hypothetical protein E6Q88_09525 [Lysobacteraceae bacterium]|nr:MAG: hypothetical protein E6Q88_09525 [Xanthomonadaceae bacterium]